MASQPGTSAALAAATLRREVSSFRMAELTTVCERLGLRKTGRKAELQSRILSFFGELDPSQAAALGRSGAPRVPREQWRIEQAAKTVHDVYNRMMGISPNAPSDQSAHTVHQQDGGMSGGLQQQQQQQQQQGYGQQQAGGRYAYNLGGPPLALSSTAQQLAAQQYAFGQALADMQQQNASQALLTQLSGGLGSPRHWAGQQAQQQGQQGQGQQGQQAGVQRRPVKCICGSLAERSRMVQCQGRGCGAWQHVECVGLGGEPPGSKPLKSFRCELCRAKLADPFWEPLEQVLPPSILKPQLGRPPLVTAQGPQEVQVADRVFYLNQQQLEGVQRDPGRHRVQVGCLLAGDEVALRYHWPKHVDLRVNNIPQRPYSRAFNAKMGINQRDDAASIGAMVVRGRNSLSLSAADGGTWVLLLQLARKRTLEQVKQLMLAPESVQAAVARVKRQVGGGGGDDSDDELLISHQVVSLKDPMSGQRMQVPARFVDASGLQAFDLDSFLSMAQRNRKWQDPTTLGNSTIEQLQVDTYMQRVLACLAAHPKVTDVEISADGLWRPDGSACEWLDVSSDPASVAAQLAAAEAASAGGAAAGGGAASGRSGAASGAANGAAGGSAVKVEEAVEVGDSGEASDEEDEAEELRKAAAAARRASSAALNAMAGQKRKEPEPEVIDLLSSDDEEAPPVTLQQRQQQLAAGRAAAVAPQRQAPPPVAAAAGGHASGSGPLRIRLPVRPQQPQAGAQQYFPSAQAGSAYLPPVVSLPTARPPQYMGHAPLQQMGSGCLQQMGSGGLQQLGSGGMPLQRMGSGHLMPGGAGFNPFGHGMPGGQSQAPAWGVASPTGSPTYASKQQANHARHAQQARQARLEQERQASAELDRMLLDVLTRHSPAPPGAGAVAQHGQQQQQHQSQPATQQSQQQQQQRPGSGQGAAAGSQGAGVVRVGSGPAQSIDSDLLRQDLEALQDAEFVAELFDM